MEFENIFIGTDIEEISRFSNKTLQKDKAFLDKIYTEKEIEYSFSKGISAQHLAARFCAKEAIVKALCPVGIKDVYYRDIEILNNQDGVPYAIVEKYPDIKIKISLSHCKTTASAVAIVCV